MLDKYGCVCEYDGHPIPNVMPDTPKRAELHELAVEEGRRIISELKGEDHGQR